MATNQLRQLRRFMQTRARTWTPCGQSIRTWTSESHSCSPLREAAERLPEGCRALLVGQPANAAAVPRPTDQVIPPMGKGQTGFC